MPGNILQVDSLSEVTRLDGVYIFEQAPPGPLRAIQGNVVCVIGEFERGPVDAITSVSSQGELIDLFGGIGPDASGAFYKGMLALRNKMFGSLRVIRLSNATQVTAFVDLDDGAGAPVDVIKVAAASPGAWGNNLKATITAATDGNAAHFDLVIKQGTVVARTFRNLDLAAIEDDEEFPQTVGDSLVKVTRIELGDGSPAVVADQALSTGADGTFADADYTGGPSDVRGIELLKTSEAEDIRFFFVAEQTSAAINAAILALANSEKKVGFISGALNQTKASAKTDVALYRSDRIVYCFPAVKTFIPEANGGGGGLVTVSLNAFASSVTSIINPGRNPAGPGENAVHLRLLSGVRALADSTLGRSDYEDFRAKGIHALEVSPLGGFSFRSGVTTSLTSGLANIARRTMADYLQKSMGAFLLNFQNLPIWNQLKTMVKSAISDFLDLQIQLQLLPRREDLAAGLAPYSITFSSTPSQEAAGIFIVDVRVRIFASADFIVLRTQIGEGVEIAIEETLDAAA